MTSKVLWVLRHAKTLRVPPSGGGDHDRILNRRGRIDADALGRHLGDRGDRFGLDIALLPELVLCSTAARAAETAERVMAKLDASPPISLLSSLYGASLADVLAELAAVDDSIRSVMIVGHNPTFETLVTTMASSAPPALLAGFATCALAIFDLTVDNWSKVSPGLARLIGNFQPPY